LLVATRSVPARPRAKSLAWHVLHGDSRDTRAHWDMLARRQPHLNGKEGRNLRNLRSTGQSICLARLVLSHVFGVMDKPRLSRYLWHKREFGIGCAICAG
jgi:hypothetical protein